MKGCGAVWLLCVGFVVRAENHCLVWSGIGPAWWLERDRPCLVAGVAYWGVSGLQRCGERVGLSPHCRDVGRGSQRDLDLTASTNQNNFGNSVFVMYKNFTPPFIPKLRLEIKQKNRTFCGLKRNNDMSSLRGSK